MTILPFELSTVVADMHNAYEAKLYYPCLLVGLTLPEICSGLTLPKETFVKAHHYIKFIDTYAKPNEVSASGQDIYRLRGGLVHRGDLRGHAHLDATHVIITVPESKSSLHAFSIEVGEKTAWMIDLRMFVNGMDAAVRRWYDDNKSHPLLADNLPNLIRFSPSGLAPFVAGLPAVVSGT